jgi:hypothetical protein
MAPMISEEKVQWATRTWEERRDGQRLRLPVMVLLVGVLDVLAVLVVLAARLVCEGSILLGVSRRCDEGGQVPVGLGKEGGLGKAEGRK